jgi:hypothetical protein
MSEHKKWTYDVEPDCGIRAGQYIASIGKGGRVISVWLILSARRIRHEEPRETQGWALEVQPAPDAKPGAVYDEETNQLWVRGEAAHPFFWYPRNAK